MADRKISELTALTTPATGDLIPIVDISEVAAADKNKSITVGELLRGAPDGTAAAPGFAFESDGGNGMFLGGTDILAFSTGGTQAVTIDASQRVGLGSSSPDANSRLHIVGSSYQPLYVNTTSANGGGAVFLQQGTQTLYTGTAGSTWLSGSAATDGLVRAEANLILATNGNTRAVTIDSSQRLGVGTSGPAFRTEIVDTLQADANLHYSLVVRGDDSGTDGESAQIFLSAINATSRGAAIAAIRNSGSNDHSLAFKTSAASATPSEKVRITSDGKLGLGTSSPIFTADILSGTANTGANANNPSQLSVTGPNKTLTGGGATVFVNSNSDLAVDTGGSIALSGRNTTSSTNSVVWGVVKGAKENATSTNTAGYLAFATANHAAGGLVERMRITSTGYIFASGNESGSNVNRVAPVTDNVGYLGDSGHRWQAVYAVNGTIQTSDEREKTDIQDSALGADFIRSLRPVSYRWKIGGYETTFDEDGNRVDTPVPGVRNHYGFIAQEVKQACGNADFGGWLLEDLDDPNSKQSLRLHEFISPIVKALQEALEEIDTLKAEVAALKA